MKTNKTIIDAVNWYSEKKSVYEQLSKKVESIIQEIIIDQGIPIHDIFSRTKEIDSFAKKIEDGKYTDPTSQITDFSGIRIITYVETDLEKVCKVLEVNFEIDKERSIDKSKSLGVSKTGYRSIHYIAKFPLNRIILPEYKIFTGLYFEIQIRTILQHAWAEIEHDKNYKFSGELPSNLQRRFNILAGVLELADREFTEIATSVDNYSVSVKANAKRGELDIDINSASVQTYLIGKFDELVKKGMKPRFSEKAPEKDIFEELRSFGITSLKQLDEIIPEDFTERIFKYEVKNSITMDNYTGLIRNIMIIDNIEKYFKECWKKDWSVFRRDIAELIISYNVPLEKIIQQYDMKIEEIYNFIR